MDDQFPALDRTAVRTAWFARAKASYGCHSRSCGLGPAAPDDERQISRLVKTFGKMADDLEREALALMRPATFDRPERARAAVEVVTATGMEMTAIQRFEKAEV